MPALTVRKIVYLLLAAPGALMWGSYAIYSLLLALPVASESPNMALLSLLSILGLASAVITFFIICSLPLLYTKDRRIAIAIVSTGALSLGATLIIGGGLPPPLFSAPALALLGVALAVITELVYTPNNSFKRTPDGAA